jgi:hypothetical protein
VIGLPFAPLDLPAARVPLGPAAVGAILTGLLVSVLVVLARHWNPLRMKLARVA